MKYRNEVVIPNDEMATLKLVKYGLEGENGKP